MIADRLVQRCPIPKFRSVPPPNATPVLFATGGCGLERSSAAVSSFSDPSVPCDAACSQYLPREHWHYASSSSQHGRVSGCDQECMNSSGLFSRGMCSVVVGRIRSIAARQHGYIHHIQHSDQSCCCARHLRKF